MEGKKRKRNRRRYLEQNKAEAETNCQGIAQANSQNSKYYRVPLERKGNESEILKVRPPFCMCIQTPGLENQSTQLYQAPRYVGKDREKRSKKRPCAALVLFKHVPGNIQRRFGVITRSPR